MKIEYWSDYACPYCYIGESRLEKAVEGLGVDVDLQMRAFELDRSAPASYHGTTVERFARKYGLSKEKAAERIDGISKMGRSDGLKFEYAKTRYTNTFDAHRLTKLIEDKRGSEAASAATRALFDAYFAKEAELSDRALLIEIGESNGLLRTEVEELLDGDGYTQEVRSDEDMANTMGIHAVPYFVIDGKYAVPGALSVEDFKNVIADAMRENLETVQDDLASCGPDGCRF